MSNPINLNDRELGTHDITVLESLDAIINFFAHLGYDVDSAQPMDRAALGMDTDDLRYQIQHIHKVGADPSDGEIEVYFFQVHSVTMALMQTLARQFRKRGGTFLLVLTSDFEKLDFVLLDRSVAEGKTPTSSLRTVSRPRILTVARRSPGVVEKRVLKRFTFTEADGYAQAEKLSSAYSIAEWSQPNFNNRALFSDYYLNDRLTDSKLTVAWDEDVRPVGQKAHGLLAKAREQFTSKPEQETRTQLIEPLFKALGLQFKAVKDGADATEVPDYRLYDPAKPEHPIALALTYVWNRNLDDTDPQRDTQTSNEIPGALVVSLLQTGEAPWVIVTNGKLWRLYSSTTSNKATNYYEIDLEEALFAPEVDRIAALKYWWLFFRREAFTGFLDKVLSESADYAKDIGDRLKNRVFESIFPHFSEGFIASMRAQGVPENEINLEATFNATLTFLYRLMFVLYAESLELLPVKEERGYGANSLSVMKREIAIAGKDIEDAAPALLRAHYSRESTALYERLQVIFHAIDTGDESLNLPTYNGGLFSPENISGMFLEQYAIPDDCLALGLDRLARDIDARRGGLMMIDFKSLGVRHLGSIYEGLLEFKVRIADKPMAVVKDGKREVYLSPSEVKGKRVIATVETGDVYLENTNKERKATGSYYTPDYIVKYIVEHTVGPVLEAKFETLTPRLRDAQHQYRQQRDYARKKGENPEKFWNEDAMQRLADDCLSVRVLDPAMGSGHFLVEAVDFISNRLIDFLNGWTENPVWAALDRIRTDIIQDMERQHVSIDADKLTRVALLKRAVLKRCVYGVDLNLMAVELAKVSLWLDAFTLGAPLSFLDHHLKFGNSLIGARVGEVTAALEGAKTLFSQNKFAGVMLATDLMQQVSYLSDNTVAQVRASQNAYRDARDHLAPYKRVLDVYTSRWFGNTPSKGKRGAGEFDPTIEFLRRDDTQTWLEDPYNAANRLPVDDYMKAGLVAKTSLDATESKHFFHWELEFPEVFFAPAVLGGQDVKLREDGGFDAIVGNPPYIRIQTLDKEVGIYFSKSFDAAIGSYDIYAIFVERGLFLLNPTGYNGFILPHKFFQAEYGAPLRNLITAGRHIMRIVHFADQQIFEGATTYVCILVLSKADREHFYFTKVENIDDWSKSDKLSSDLITSSIS